MQLKIILLSITNYKFLAVSVTSAPVQRVFSQANFLNAPLVYKPCTNHFTRHTHLLTLLQLQTFPNYFSPFSHTLQQSGIVCNTLLCHLIILVCLRILFCISIIWVYYIISFCYYMYSLHIMHSVISKKPEKCVQRGAASCLRALKTLNLTMTFTKA